MGGLGSGGHKTTPGDTETHSAWIILAQDSNNGQKKLAQVRCQYCQREMAQHTSRQRAHLLTCTNYLEAMKAAGMTNSITEQAADPAAFFKNSKVLQNFNEPKPPKVLKMSEHSIAVRIQALALAEAYVSLDRIQEITGVDQRVTVGLKKIARERGYDPNVSMVLKEEYVQDVPVSSKAEKKAKRRRTDDFTELDPELPDDSPRAVQTSQQPRYQHGEQLPPGNWNFMAPVTGYPVA